MSSRRSDPVPANTSVDASYVLAGQSQSAGRLAGGLYLVATPIGNLGDITLRALETLAAADLIACEDTRVTRRLTERFGIKTPLKPYHDHNAEAARPGLLARLSEGATIALVSDAGTPLISDPGYKLVRAAHAAGHAVTALPGASSVLTALAVAGLPTDKFFFEGFLPAKEGARRSRLEELALIGGTLVLFESGSRVAATLHDLAVIMGERDGAICRELTKLHEEVRRGTLRELSDASAGLETRGEFVLLVGPPSQDEQLMSLPDLDNILRDALASQSLKDAVAHGVEVSGRPRREVYARALDLNRDMKTASGDDR